jgi:type IV secretion system protein VirB4
MAPKREYYVVKPAGSRVLDFRFGPRSLYLLSQTDKEISEHIKALAADDPNYWLNDLRDSKLTISKPVEQAEMPDETA